jgi:hypothetical protein
MIEKIQLLLFSLFYWKKNNPAKFFFSIIILIFAIPWSVIAIAFIIGGFIQSRQPLLYIGIILISIASVLAIGFALRKLSDWLSISTPVGPSVEPPELPSIKKMFLRAVELTVAVTVAKILTLYFSR